MQRTLNDVLRNWERYLQASQAVIQSHRSATQISIQSRNNQPPTLINRAAATPNSTSVRLR